jgi:DNA polymerase III epsilon subunit-like protein
MRLIAFLDTETSGLRKNLLPEDEQPHLLQIACKVVDEENNVVSYFSRVIRPDGWVIEPEAEAIHGISASFASRVGVDLFIAMIDLQASITGVDEIVGYNIHRFDRAVITDSIKRCKRKDGTPADGSWWFKAAPKIVDLMELATPILKLPGKHGDYKWPKLTEAVRYYGDEKWEQTHRADADIEAIEFLYWKMRGMVTA